MSRAGHDNLSPFQIHDFRLSSRQADNKFAGKCLSHMQNLGYRSKQCSKYVIMSFIQSSAESKPQNSVFRNNPENFHLTNCIYSAKRQNVSFSKITPNTLLVKSYLRDL